MVSCPEIHVKASTWHDANPKATIFLDMDLMKPDLEHPSRTEESRLLRFPPLHRKELFFQSLTTSIFRSFSLLPPSTEMQ